jgi:hypothetical protein
MGLKAFLASTWMPPFSRGYFIIIQPMKTSGDTWVNAPKR